MKIEINIDQKQLEYYILEEYYKNAKRKIKDKLEEHIHYKIDEFLTEKLTKEEFKKMLYEAVLEILEKYKIRDLDQIKDTLGLK